MILGYILVSRDPGDLPNVLENFMIAPSEKIFWQAVETPLSLPKRLGGSFVELLTRVMLRAAPLMNGE